jgi:uncharacterized protein YneF (UPF0154 family)
MEAIVVALLGKIILVILAIPLVIGLLIGYFVGKGAGRLAAHRELQEYAALSAQQGRPVMPPPSRRALPRRRRAA